MKSLIDYKDEINKCSKCGLCQSVCPVFKETGNECAVSKGKFIMLDGVLKGDLKLNKNISKYLDMCLKCGKCSDFCPSGIDVCKIFETAKYEYAKNTISGKFIFFLESKFVFGNLIKILKRNNRSTVQHFNHSTKLKLLYFSGCVGNIFPKTREFLKKLPDIDIMERDFDCCGIPFLSSGNLERYEEVKKHNLELMNCDFDYILTDCASCESTLKNYFNNEKQKAKSGKSDNFQLSTIQPFNISTDKFISLGELIVKQGIKFKSKKPVKVTFHKPCHLENADFIKPLFENCENIEYIEMEGFDDCCGFAGEFALKNRKISNSISDKKAQNIIATGADFVITTCPSCILGLRQGLFNKKNSPKVISLTDFLNKLIF